MTLDEPEIHEFSIPITILFMLIFGLIYYVITQIIDTIKYLFEIYDRPIQNSNNVPHFNFEYTKSD